MGDAVPRRERYPAGDYPNQHPGGAGLPDWTAADRSLGTRTSSLWYVFGAHHMPRPEDWPVMPVGAIGFTLKPDGFFDRNPALDVPPPRRTLPLPIARPLEARDGEYSQNGRLTGQPTRR